MREVRAIKWNIVVLAIFAVVLLRTAWLSDDSMITIRTILNFVHGYGPVFNLGERVQAFTHPLWFLILSLGSFLFKNVFYVNFAFSIFLSIAAVFLLTLQASSNRHLVWIILLLCSKAFIDYSTSGLENPLSHAMMIWGFGMGYRYFRSGALKDAQLSLVILATAYLCRPDMILLTLPLGILILMQLPPQQRWKASTIAVLPVAIWTLFSIFYYGFPFPNTAYAKLGNGIPQIQLIVQGFRYTLDSIQRDPLTLSIILIGIIMGFSDLRKETKSLAIGVFLYLIYIVWIGGDFMSGRFFSVPLVASIFILLQIQFSEKWRFLFVILFLFALWPIKSTWLSGPNYSNRKYSDVGITDERGYYFQEFGLLKKGGFNFKIVDWSIQNKNVIIGCTRLGTNGLVLGPGTHWVDPCGLTDPLLARMPRMATTRWRIGHFYRQVPTNYEYLLMFNDPTRMDPNLYEYWKELHVVTSGKLFSSERLRTIARLNLRQVHQPDFSRYAHEIIPSRIVPGEIFEKMDIVETGPSERDLFYFSHSLEIEWTKPIVIRSLDLSLDGKDYVLMYKQSDRYVELLQLHPNSDKKMTRFQISLKTPTTATRSIRIIATDNFSSVRLGHLFINRKIDDSKTK